MGMSNEEDIELDAVLIGMVGRRLTVGEIITALEMSPTTYYQQRAEGRLVGRDNAAAAARNLGINEVELLLRCGLLNPQVIEEYLEVRRSELPLASSKGKGVTKPRTERTQNRTVRLADRRDANIIRRDSAPL